MRIEYARGDFNIFLLKAFVETRSVSEAIVFVETETMYIPTFRALHAIQKLIKDGLLVERESVQQFSILRRKVKMYQATSKGRELVAFLKVE